MVRLSQIMYFKSQKYTVGHLFVYYKNQLSEFIFKEIMQTRYKIILYRQFLDTCAVHFHHSYLVDIHFFLLSFPFYYRNVAKTFLC